MFNKDLILNMLNQERNIRNSVRTVKTTSGSKDLFSLGNSLDLPVLTPASSQRILKKAKNFQPIINLKPRFDIQSGKALKLLTNFTPRPSVLPSISSGNSLFESIPLNSPQLKSLNTTPLLYPKYPESTQTRMSTIGGFKSEHRRVKNCISKCFYKITSDSQDTLSRDSCIIYPKIAQVKGQYLFALCDGKGDNEIETTRCFKKSVISIFNYKLAQLTGPLIYMQLSSLVYEAIGEAHDQTCSLTSSTVPYKNNLSCLLVLGDKIVCGNCGTSKVVIGQKTESWEANLISNSKVLSSKTFSDPAIDQTQIKITGLEIFEYQLLKRDKFIIIANNAFWTYMTPQEAVEIISTFWKKGKTDGCLDVLLNQVAARRKKYSKTPENLSIILIFCNSKS